MRLRLRLEPRDDEGQYTSSRHCEGRLRQAHFLQGLALKYDAYI